MSKGWYYPESKEEAQLIMKISRKAKRTYELLEKLEDQLLIGDAYGKTLKALKRNTSEIRNRAGELAHHYEK